MVAIKKIKTTLALVEAEREREREREEKERSKGLGLGEVRQDAFSNSNPNAILLLGTQEATEGKNSAKLAICDFAES